MIHEAPAYGFSAGNSGQSYGIGLTEDGTPPIRAGASGTNQAPTVAYDEPFAGFDSTGGSQDMGNCDGRVAPTIKVGSSTAASRETRTIVRRLTPLECERLMGWPDNYTAHGIDDNGQSITIANTNRYRICGNGIVATVTHWIGQRLPDITEAAEQEAA